MPSVGGSKRTSTVAPLVVEQNRDRESRALPREGTTQRTRQNLHDSEGTRQEVTSRHWLALSDRDWPRSRDRPHQRRQINRDPDNLAFGITPGRRLFGRS